MIKLISNIGMKNHVSNYALIPSCFASTSLKEIRNQNLSRKIIRSKALACRWSLSVDLSRVGAYGGCFGEGRRTGKIGCLGEMQL